MSLGLAIAALAECSRTASRAESLESLRTGCVLLKRDGASTEAIADGSFCDMLRLRDGDPDYTIRLPSGQIYPHDVER